MTDIRHRLNVRREQLIEREAADHKTLNAGQATSSRFQTAARNVEELRSIDATLATMQLADAQKELANSQRQVAEAQQESNRQSAKEGADREELGYWTRRFLTNITIANSAGFAAIVLFISKPDSPIMDFYQVSRAARYFLIGMIMGGALPLLAITGIALTMLSNKHRQEVGFFAKLAVAAPTKNAMVGLYAIGATVLLMLGIATTYKTATDYYAQRSAFEAPLKDTSPIAHRPSPQDKTGVAASQARPDE